jgi:uncharacterized protein (DUF924 family)
MHDSSLPSDAQDVLAFWLGAWPVDSAALQRAQPTWFQKNEAFDADLRQRFGGTIAAALAGQHDAWADTAQGRLALLIVLDQFTRNSFRGKPESFAGDDRALRIALEGIARGHDIAVPPMPRTFCYLPLEHAEDAAMQSRSVALFQALRDAPDAQPKPGFDGSLDYAHKHQDVIRRFGRFPHRNAILGRASTPDELAYLAQPGSGF